MLGAFHDEPRLKDHLLARLQQPPGCGCGTSPVGCQLGCFVPFRCTGIGPRQDFNLPLWFWRLLNWFHDRLGMPAVLEILEALPVGVDVEKVDWPYRLWLAEKYEASVLNKHERFLAGEVAHYFRRGHANAIVAVQLANIAQSLDSYVLYYLVEGRDLVSCTMNWTEFGAWNDLPRLGQTAPYVRDAGSSLAQLLSQLH